MDVASPRLIHVVTTRLSDVGDRRCHRHLNAQHLAGGMGRSPTETHEDASSTGAHEMQGCLVGGAAANDHGDVEIVNELTQVENVVTVGHVLRRHRRATDDEKVRPGIDHRLGETRGILR